MKNRNAEFDVYIEKSPAYSRPILKKLRRLVHKAEPQIEEVIKWSAPCFQFQGLIAGMGAYKKHVRFSFLKAESLDDPQSIFERSENKELGTLKLTSNKDLPEDSVLIEYLHRAVKLNVDGKKAQRNPTTQRPPPELPSDLQAALKLNRKAHKTYEDFSPSHQREYVEWLTEAKREETRAKRLSTTIEWLSEGKPRNWKYMKKP